MPPSPIDTNEDTGLIKAPFNVAAAGTDTLLVTGVTGKKIRVHQMVALCGATPTDLTLNSKGSGAGTAITPTFPHQAGGGEVMNFNPEGWFETNVDESLTATTGSGVSTALLLGYSII